MLICRRWIIRWATKAFKRVCSFETSCVTPPRRRLLQNNQRCCYPTWRCQTGASRKIVLQECRTRVPEQFSTRVSYRSGPQACRTTVSHKSVLQECHRKAPHTGGSYQSVAQECQSFRVPACTRVRGFPVVFQLVYFYQ